MVINHLLTGMIIQVGSCSEGHQILEGFNLQREEPKKHESGS